jgi:hypothetical protein
MTQMAEMIYVEPGEEITDLVERVRGTGTDSDLVFVLPNGSRLLQSELNLRLLQQYARSFMKSAAVVSGDARTQRLAAENGLPVYASVPAYQRGVQAVGAGAAFGAAVGAGTGAGMALAASGVTEAPPAPPPGAGAPPIVTPPRPRPIARGPRERGPGIYVAAASVFLIGILLLFLVAPAAKVTVVLQATPVKEDNLTVQGTPDPNVAKQADRVLTVVTSSDANGTFDFKATGQKNIPAAAAQSAVQFSTRFHSPFCLHIVKGTVLGQIGSLNWAATAAPPDDAACPGGKGVYVPMGDDVNFGQPSKLIAVTASATGAAGNVGTGAINQIDPGINGCNPANYPAGGAPSCAPSDFAVSNPSAATGGVDAKTLTVVSVTDIATYKQNLDTTTKTLTEQVKQSMQAKAPGKVFAIDPTHAGMTITTQANPPAPNAGDQAPADQQVTVSVHGGGAMYDPADVKSRLEDKLRADASQAQSGAVLDQKSKVIHDPVVQQAGDDGIVVFSISGSGYATPPVDTEKLKGSFTGKTKSAVKQTVTEQYGSAVQDVQISQAIPFFVLPFFSSRIEVSVCVRSPDQAC